MFMMFKKYRGVSSILALLLCFAMVLGFSGCDALEELEALNKMNSELQEVADLLKNQLSNLQDEVNSLKEENEALKEENEALKAELNGEEQVEIVDPDGYAVSETVTDMVCINVTYTASNGKRTNGNIVVKLDASQAPITVANFQKLVSEQFYDGLTFHRVYKGFMIQGGDPTGTGSGDSGTLIKGEFSANGVENNISHVRGVISMAREYSSMDSASCQFFIMHEDATYLDGKYAGFGEVVYGMDTVDGIAGTSVTYNSYGELTLPINTVKINSAYFVTVVSNISLTD